MPCSISQTMLRTPLFPGKTDVVAGVDEAGRGPLAGPVVAAAVILAPGQATCGMRDSKKMTAAARERIAARIRSESLAWSVAWADCAEIDCLNILGATMLAMRRAILGLAVVPGALQIDGNRLPNLRFYERQLDGDAVVRGDASVPAISAASILAKTARDGIMVRMDALYPDYAFAQHKGYATAMHRNKLHELGPCNLHRRSFAPVRAAS